MRVRSAQPGESEQLSALAFASKALWGYTTQQLRAWAIDLRISSESIARQPTFVIDADGHLAGVLQLNCASTPWDIECLWVHPALIRRGVGTRLVRHALACARERGHSEVRIDADPHAEAFYLRLGARRVGEIAAPIEGQPRRIRPQLVLGTGSATSCGIE